MMVYDNKLSINFRWRVLSLSLMAVTFIILLTATMSTNWREDQEDRYNVYITQGLWRICRDIKFGATLDHKCLAEYANDGPDWFQTVRAFMLMALLACFGGLCHAVYMVVTLPVIKNKNYPNVYLTFTIPAILYLLGAVCVLIGVATYSVATAMSQALYFPENLPPTWGNSWAQVLAKRNSIPSDLPEVKNMKMSYGYSFGLAWLSFFTTTATFVVSFIASGS